ncbi:MAG: hypothetical protein HC862_31985 [Scytonema sp. RU_4_4]|nr:hypothetical protein [Scytonema sp. RU_4_4]
MSPEDDCSHDMFLTLPMPRRLVITHIFSKQAIALIIRFQNADSSVAIVNKR